jgi:glucose/arabinose dehydrogenase
VWAGAALLGAVELGCGAPGDDDAVVDAGVVHPPRMPFTREPGRRYFCDLPAPDVPRAGFPYGFCVRRFATVRAPRVMAFAPNGDLFVASPGIRTPGGAPPGAGEIVVLSDDDGDGVAESTTFAHGLNDVHGLLFGQDGWLYFTRTDGVYRTAYTPGQRRVGPMAAERVADLSGLAPGPRWTHTLAQSADGAMYVSQGQYGSFTCPSSPFAGAIFRVRAEASGARPEMVSTGFRNPMYLRCDPSGARCYAAELSDDAWHPRTGILGREKLVFINPGEDYGYPCCAGNGAVAPSGRTLTDCRAVTRELGTWPLHDTPFGMDFERGNFPAPWRGGFFVALHGAYGTWANTKIIWSPLDPATGHPTGRWQDFVTGWGVSAEGIRGRLTDLVFARDGRMFFSDDQGGAVYWLSPEPLAVPQP